MNHLAIELRNVSDQELHSRMMSIAKKEQQTTLEVLVHLHEVSVRALFAKRGFASLWEYTVRALGYAEAQASERIKAMQLMFRVSEVKEALETGKLNLTQAAMAERHLRAEEKETKTRVPAEEVRELIFELAGKTKRETEVTLLTLRPLKSEPVKETMRAMTEEISEVRFPVNEETRKAIERYWELNGRCSLSEVFTTCLEFLLKAKDPMPQIGAQSSTRSRGEEEVKTTKPDSTSLLLAKVDEATETTRSTRYISKHARREVLGRSQGCCEYVDPETNRRCQSRYRLEFDHIYAFALGGTSDASNLRVLCSNHNRYLAKKMYAVAREPGAPYTQHVL